ncbi:MAG: hypothetical protein IJR54_07285 [Oscillibacter sp.]|nr:hypothetical protein [Oscillibacter sp.]
MDTVSYMDMFGLNQKQLNVLYAIELAVAEKDAAVALKGAKKHWTEKVRWIRHWRELLEETGEVHFYPELEIPYMIQRCDDGINRIWFYLVMMEASLFTPYFPFAADKGDKDAQKENQEYAKLKYTPQTGYLEELARNSGLMDPSYIKRFQKAYQQARFRISGGVKNVALGGLSVIAAAGVAAAAAGVFAGPIAVALVGSNFAGFSGAALVSASLAYLGGGAIAAGGTGMAGGVAAIVGGGAILGAAGGGAMVSAVGAISKNFPDLMLTQTAKLDVVMREILLNSQADVQNAQLVMSRLKEQIHELQRQLDEMKLNREHDRKTMDALKKTLQYLREAYQDMNRFQSSYAMGRAAKQ